MTVKQLLPEDSPIIVDSTQQGISWLRRPFIIFKVIIYLFSYSYVHGYQHVHSMIIFTKFWSPSHLAEARLTQTSLIILNESDAFTSMTDTVLNKVAFASRVRRVYDSWTVRTICFLIFWHILWLDLQNARENEDYSSIADVDALLLVAGDPISEEEPMRKGSCFQVDFKDKCQLFSVLKGS